MLLYLITLYYILHHAGVNVYDEACIIIRSAMS